MLRTVTKDNLETCCKFSISLNKEFNGRKKLVSDIEQFVLETPKIRPLTRMVYDQDFSGEFVRNEDGTYDHESNTVPSSLLRHFFRSQLALSNVNCIRDFDSWKDVLCKIERTIECIKLKKIPFREFMEWNQSMRAEKYFYGFGSNAFDTIYNSEDGEYTIAKAVLVRVEFGHRLMEYFHTVQDKRLKFASQLFVDTHLDLICAMINNRDIEDKDLMEEFGRNAGLQSTFYRYYPHDTRFSYCGDLPDFTTCIDLGNIWYDVRPKQKNFVSYVIHIFGSKVVKHKCSERNFLRILIDKYCKEYPIFNDIYKLLLEVSLMGNYPHANFRSSFLRRLEIRNEFHHSRTFDSVDTFHKWMNENESLVVLVSKEFHMYTVTSQYSLDVIMEETKSWKEVKIVCIRSMDMIRSTLSNNLFYNEFNGEGITKENVEQSVFESLQTIKGTLATLDQKMSVLLDKLKKCSFLIFMLFNIESYFQKQIVDKRSTVAINNEDVLPKDVLNAIEIVAMFVSVKFNMFIPTKYLKCFGISEFSYNKIRDFYFDYEKYNIPDNSIKNVLKEIHMHDEKDFYIIRIYFQAIKKYKSFRTFPFTTDHLNSVLYSIKTKRMIEPWVPLREEQTRYYFCVICKRWACPIVDPNSIESVVNVFSLGKEKVSRDPHSEKLYCGKQVTPIIIKKYMEDKIYSYQGKIDDEGIAKAIRNHKSTFNCSTVPLIYVNLPWVIMSNGGKKWGACDICTQPTVFEGAKLDCNGFTCCFHEKPRDKKPQMSVEEGIKIIKDPFKGDKLNETRMKLGIARTKQKEDYCIYCGNLCDEGKNVKINLMDDTNLYAYYEASLCLSDYELVKNVINLNKILLKSMLFEQILISRTRASINFKILKKKSSHPSTR